MTFVIGIDIGGTCTDCVVIDSDGAVTLAKAFSTPPDFSRGILDALGVASAELNIELSELLGDTSLFLHSTTVAENAVVDGTLATAGLITTRGFEDTLFAMRGGYGRWSGLTEEEKRNPIDTDKPSPIISRDRIVGIHERVRSDGEVIAAPDAEEIKDAVRQLLAGGAEAIGVCLLWSFANPGAEIQIRDVVRSVDDDVFITLSHELAPMIGEYERSSTVALNARLGPVVRRYLDRLDDDLRALGFSGTLLVMQAYGGLLPFKRAAETPVGMIESGPVSGLVGSQQLGEHLGIHNIIGADMGGTTFKVGTIRDGFIDYQQESAVLRYHYSLPKLDIVSLGLAGGSVITVDARTGTPHVGPRSAGSYPGPVAYGHGGREPTITDVDAILGYLNPAYFLGGRVGLDIDAARDAFEESVARPLGMEVIPAAASIYRLANSLFHDLLHKVTVQRGLDPRDFAIFSFGGTAGMHVAAYAEELGVREIVVPYSASVHGAFGLITSDIAHDEQITRPMRDPVDVDVVASLFDELESKVRDQLQEEGFSHDEMKLDRRVDMRFRRQVHILTVPVEDGPLDREAIDRSIARFEQLYQGKYGEDSAYRDAGIELVSFRVRGTGIVLKPEPHELNFEEQADDAAVTMTRAWVDKNNAMQDIPGYDFERLHAGHRIDGPAIVWTPVTTLVLAPGQVARVDRFRNIRIAMSEAADADGSTSRP